MANNEGIGSPVARQSSARSGKLRIYESIFLFNQGIDHVVNLLRRMEKLSLGDRRELRFAQVEIEGVRCDMNADFAEQMADSERFDGGRISKQRRDYDKKWRDPDDVYIEVERREEERRKQGLPPRVGIVPHSAVAAEEQRREGEQERKKELSGKCRKSASQAGSRLRGKGHD